MRAQDFYGTTLEALVEAKNERLWFKTQLKLCGLWFKLKEYGRAQKILRELHRCAPVVLPHFCQAGAAHSASVRVVLGMTRLSHSCIDLQMWARVNGPGLLAHRKALDGG